MYVNALSPPVLSFLFLRQHGLPPPCCDGATTPLGAEASSVRMLLLLMLIMHGPCLCSFVELISMCSSQCRPSFYVLLWNGMKSQVNMNIGSSRIPSGAFGAERYLIIPAVFAEFC